MKKTERMIWILVVMAIIGWNVFNHRGWSAGDRAATEPGKTPPMRSPRRASSPDQTQPGRQRRSGDTASDVRSRSLRALHSSDPLVRLTDLLEVLASCDRRNIDEVSAALAELGSTGIPAAVEEDLVNFRAGQLKGSELLSSRTGSPDDFTALKILKKQYEGWSQTDPAAAGRWLDDLPAGKYRDQMAVAYITARAKEDPLASLNVAGSLHPSQQSAAGRAAGQRLAESASADEASQWLQTMGGTATPSDQSYMKGVFDSLIESTARKDGQAATALLEDHLKQPYVTESALAKVSAEKAKADPAAALGWAVEIEGKKPTLAQGSVIQAAVGAMTLDGLAAAENWTASRAGTGWQGLDWLEGMIKRRREILENRGNDANEYDRDD